jgi:hypothetical protein
VDPLFKSYPALSSYQFSSNNPILNIDLDGMEGANSNVNNFKKATGTTIITRTTQNVTKELAEKEIERAAAKETAATLTEEGAGGATAIISAPALILTAVFTVVFVTPVGHDEIIPKIKPKETITTNPSTLTNEEVKETLNRLRMGTHTPQDLLYQSEINRRFSNISQPLSVVRETKFNERPLIIDENLSPQLATELVGKGFNVITVAKGTPDEVIIDYAKINNAIVVTNNDKDFVNKGVTVFKVSENLKPKTKIGNVVKAIENVNDKSKSNPDMLIPGNKTNLTEHQ